MADDKQIEPTKFFTNVPKGATLIGRVEERDAFPTDPSIEGEPEYAHRRIDLSNSIKKTLIRKAAEEYPTNEGERLFLVERSSKIDYWIAGVSYKFTADVYKGRCQG